MTLFIDKATGTVFGWGVTSTFRGDQYIDKHNNGFAEVGLIPAALMFAEKPLAKRWALENHITPVGQTALAFPITTAMCAALGIQSERTGILVAMRVDQATLEKIARGDLRAISYGSRIVEDHAVET